MYNIIKNVINGGRYNAEELVEKIDTFWVQGKLTAEERAELIQLAYDKAQDASQVDVFAKLADLENRVYALEHKDDPEPEPAEEYPIYQSGDITAKGGIVRFDYDNDGEYELLQYNGGRATTALAPGKVTGWNVLDENLNVIGTYYKGEFTPVEQPSEGENEETLTEGE